METFLSTPRNYLRPDAVGHVYRLAAKFLRYMRADQITGRYHLVSDVFFRRAEAQVIMGGAAPHGSVSILP